MKKIKKWYEKYERWLIPGSLVVGFIVDAVTFQSINLELAFTFLFFYLLISLATITFIHFYDEGLVSQESTILEYIKLFAPIIIQYTFGALLSGFLIFYGFNGVLSTSWPFILIIVFLMISNDLLKRYYIHTAVQISVYYFILFSFLALVLPFLFKSLSAWIFIISGVVSFFLIRFYVGSMALYVKEIKNNDKILTWSVSIIFLAMNLFYFTNIIPPIPLSLRESGVYHDVERQLGSTEYNFYKEKYSWIDNFRLYPHISYDDSIYVFSSVFAPINLEADIVHHWQYYDEETEEWVSTEKIEFPITGGRDGGYRGYSEKNNIRPGFWAVDIEAGRGQDIGRVRFKVTEDIQ